MNNMVPFTVTNDDKNKDFKYQYFQPMEVFYGKQ